MTKNEELLTVTDENKEKLRALVEKAKTWAPKLFQQHYKITPEEFEKKEDESKNEYSMRQIIIARKDLNMSAGKLAAQRTTWRYAVYGKPL